MNFTNNNRHEIYPCTVPLLSIARQVKNLGIKCYLESVQRGSEQGHLVVNRQPAPVVHFATVF